MSAVKFLGAGIFVLGMPALVLWISGDWHWTEGWIFGIWFSAFQTACLAWMYLKDPALLAERLRRPGTGGQSRADLVILVSVKVAFLIWMILPPLGKRFGWTTLPVACDVVGGILLLAGSVLVFHSFTDNPFLSQLVRIQNDRGHRVVDTGVYGFVRHPMYLGASLMLVGGPMLLGSGVGLLVGLGSVVLFVLRIYGEEKLLADDLAGYSAYRAKVRYRLVPRVW
jgi:protein-S-isoprenylcysteine O-methyltransferase Ste14